MVGWRFLRRTSHRRSQRIAPLRRWAERAHDSVLQVVATAKASRDASHDAESPCSWDATAGCLIGLEHSNTEGSPVQGWVSACNEMQSSPRPGMPHFTAPPTPRAGHLKQHMCPRALKSGLPHAIVAGDAQQRGARSRKSEGADVVQQAHHLHSDVINIQCVRGKSFSKETWLRQVGVHGAGGLSLNDGLPLWPPHWAFSSALRPYSQQFLVASWIQPHLKRSADSEAIATAARMRITGSVRLPSPRLAPSLTGTAIG